MRPPGGWTGPAGGAVRLRSRRDGAWRDAYMAAALVAALRRGLPHVNLCAGHNVTHRPDFIDSIRRDIAIQPSATCLGAVEEPAYGAPARTCHPIPTRT